MFQHLEILEKKMDSANPGSPFRTLIVFWPDLQFVRLLALLVAGVVLQKTRTEISSSVGIWCGEDVIIMLLKQRHLVLACGYLRDIWLFTRPEQWTALGHAGARPFRDPGPRKARSQMNQHLFKKTQHISLTKIPRLGTSVRIYDSFPLTSLFISL